MEDIWALGAAGALGTIGVVGSVVLLIIAFLAFLSPIFFYLIQRNTCQTRDELRKANKNIETLCVLLDKQTDPLLNNSSGQKTAAKEADNQTSDTVTMVCEHCEKAFKYGRKHSGTNKPCPGCKKVILLD